MSTSIRIFLLLLVTLHLHAQKSTIKLGNNAVLLLERALFQAAGKRIEHYKQPSVPITVDGKPGFGTDGEVPKYYLAKAVLVAKQISYNLSVAGMYNPWFGAGPSYGPAKDAFRLMKKGSAYKLQAVFSDGAGSYYAEWLVAGKTSKRTALSTDVVLLENYLKNGPHE